MVPIKTLFYFRFKSFPPHLTRVPFRHFSDLTLDEIKALIPKKIERGPTDVLRALAETCKRDPTAYDYKFMDDPYFYPLTANAKRIHSLCLESGRKSARWIVKQYPELFDHKVSDPFIEALAPKIEFNEDSDVAEETLLKVIEERDVANAIYVYSLLKKKDVEISKDTKQLLLELVCFYNCEKLYEEELESNWYKERDVKDVSKSWKDKGFAEELFRDMNSDCSLAYSTLIQGMLKFGQVEEAVNLLESAQEKDLKLTVWVYNGLIDSANTLYQSNNQRWAYVIKLLNEMKMNQIMPNIFTLNSTLKALREMEAYPMKRKKAISILIEFENLGIVPSLGTYYYMLQIMCTHKSSDYRNEKYLRETLAKIDKKKLDIRHPDDLKFFAFTMRLCKSLRDTKSAEYLVDLLQENNENLIGGSLNQTAFYKFYLTLAFEEEPIEHAMQIYKKLVPTICNIDEPTYLKILFIIKENESFEFLPTIWNHLKDFFAPSKIIGLSLNILDLVEVWDGKGEEVSSIFENLAEMWFNKIESGENIFFSESMESNLMIAFLKLKNFDKALFLFERVSEKRFFALNFKAIEHFYNFCLENEKEKDYILRSLKLAEKADHPTVHEMAKKALSRLENDEENLMWVKKLAETPKKKKEQEEKDEVESETEKLQGKKVKIKLPSEEEK